MRGARGLAAVRVGTVTEGKQSVTGGRVAGWKHGKKDACVVCGGKGTVEITLDNRKDTVTCGNCGGSGKA